MNPSYQKSDYQSLEFHKLVVTKLQEDPSLIQKALNNIYLWKIQNTNPQPYLDEWLIHIDKELDHLLAFLESETDEAQRLRSSSPFVGIITQEERMIIRRKFHGPRP